MKPHHLIINGCVLACMAALFAACSKPAPSNRIVKADTSEQFDQWRSDRDDWPPQEQQDFDIAIQEIKLDVMNKSAGTMASRQDAMLEIVNGKSVRAVETLGWHDRRDRLEREKKDMETRFAHDSKLAVREDQTERAQTLATITRNEQGIIAKNTGLISEVDAKLQGWESAPNSGK